MFKVGDKVKVVRDCSGAPNNNGCAFCPPIGLVGTIVVLDGSVVRIDTYERAGGSIPCEDLEYVDRPKVMPLPLPG